MFKIPIQAVGKMLWKRHFQKKKLLNKQAKGKKRMKAMAKVNMPQEAFMAVIKMDRSGGE